MSNVNPIDKKESNELKFQILDWNYYHDENDDGRKQFTIRLFGRTKENKTIYVKVNKYTPYFYVEIPKTWRNTMINNLLETVKNKVFPKENNQGLIQHKVI